MVLSLLACDPQALKNDTSQNADKVHLNHKPFKIGGIGFGSPVKDVESKMGNPLIIKSSPEVCEESVICEYWEYKDTKFYFYDGRLEGMETKSPLLCLFGSVCPEQPIENVFKLIGKTKIWPASTDKPALLHYSSKEYESCWLWVFLNSEKNTIQEFRLACQP